MNPGLLFLGAPDFSHMVFFPFVIEFMGHLQQCVSCMVGCSFASTRCMNERRGSVLSP